MLIQRPECPTNTKSSDISGHYANIPQLPKMQQQQQQQHVKRLLSTAATGTGIVGDVDALATPPQLLTAGRIENKTERNLWRLEEIKEVLAIMQQTNAVELLNDKTIKSEKVFRYIEKMMNQKGFRKKSFGQIWTKWKFLKSTYVTSRRNGVIPRMIPTEIYQTLHKMLNSSSDGSVNSSNAPSLDGDFTDNEETTQHGSFNGLSTGTKHLESTDDNAFGMAHPIFGFRLGLVKSEPADTGYETTANSSVVSDIEHLENQSNDYLQREISPPVMVKNEPEENVSMSPTQLIPIQEPIVSTSPPPLVQRTTKNKECVMIFPRNTKSMSITPVINVARTTTTTTNNEESIVTTSTNLPPPPLRIAPFARERNMTEAVQRLSRPPPPLSINPNAVQNHSNASINDDIVDDGSALITKMTNQPSSGISITAMDSTTTISHQDTPRPSVLRLPKELTLQLRVGDGNTSTPTVTSRMKPMTTRQNAIYSLRPDNGNMNSNIQCNGHPTIASQNLSALAQSTPDAGRIFQDLEKPMTSRMASQIKDKLRLKMKNNKKRRLEIPKWSGGIKYENGYNERDEENIFQKNSKKRKIDSNDSECSKNSAGSNLSPPSSPVAATYPNQAAMEGMLNDLAMSLRQAQLEMIHNFFEQQMEMALKEHEFQMKQDRLIMEAFEEQSRQLMKTAKRLFGVEVKVRRDINKDEQEEEQDQEEQVEKTTQDQQKSNEQNLECETQLEELDNGTKNDRLDEMGDQMKTGENQSQSNVNTNEASSESSSNENENEDKDEQDEEEEDMMSGNDPLESMATDDASLNALSSIEPLEFVSSDLME